MVSLSQNLFLLNEAVTRLENLTGEEPLATLERLQTPVTNCPMAGDGLADQAPGDPIGFDQDERAFDLAHD